MLDDRIRKFFDWLAPRLLHGDLDWVEDVYDYPLSFFVGDKIRLETSSSETIAYILARPDQAKLYNISAKSAEVIKITMAPDMKRFSAIVDYLFHTHDGTEFGRNKSCYRCRIDEANSIRVESLEILDLGLPFSPIASSVVRH